MTVLTGPVCDAGRCSQVLRALAEAKARMEDSTADLLRGVLTGVAEDPELDLSERQRAVWPAAVVRAAGRLTGEVTA